MRTSKETVLIGPSHYWNVNHKGLNYLYAYSSVNIYLLSNDYGGFPVLKNQWTFIPFPDTTRINAPFSSDTYVIFEATSEPKITSIQPNFGLPAFELVGQAYTSTTASGFGSGFVAPNNANGYIGLQLVVTNASKSIIMHRATVSTLANAPISTKLILYTVNTIDINLGVHNPIFNHNVFLIPQNRSICDVYSSSITQANNNAISVLGGGNVEHDYAIPANSTYELLQGSTRIIPTGATGSIIVYMQFASAGQKGSIGFEWREEA